MKFMQTHGGMQHTYRSADSPDAVAAHSVCINGTTHKPCNELTSVPVGVRAPVRFFQLPNSKEKLLFIGLSYFLYKNPLQ